VSSSLSSCTKVSAYGSSSSSSSSRSSSSSSSVIQYPGFKVANSLTFGPPRLSGICCYENHYYPYTYHYHHMCRGDRQRSFRYQVKASDGRLPPPRGRGSSRFGGRGRRRWRDELGSKEQQYPMPEHIPIVSPLVPGEEGEAWGEAYVEKEYLERLKTRGITAPTAVQLSTTPKISHGYSVAVQASTGTGKTLAYMLPLLTSILRGKMGRKTKILENQGDQNRHSSDSKRLEYKQRMVSEGTVGLILTPSPELSVQTSAEIQDLHFSFNGTTVRSALMTGIGVLEDQIADISRNRPDVVVATPKQVASALKKDSGIKLFQNVSWIVIDEADRVLRPLSKYASVREKRSRALHPNPTEDVINTLLSINKHLQLMFLSATINSPLRSLMKKNRWRVEKITAGNPFEIPTQIKHMWVERKKGVKVSDLIRGIVEKRRQDRSLGCKGLQGGCMVFLIEYVDLPTFKNSLVARGLKVEMLHEITQRTEQERKEMLRRVNNI